MILCFLIGSLSFSCRISFKGGIIHCKCTNIFFVNVLAYATIETHRVLLGMQIVGIETMWMALAFYNAVRSVSCHLGLSQPSHNEQTGVWTRSLNEDKHDRAK